MHLPHPVRGRSPVAALLTLTLAGAAPALAGETVFGSTHAQRCFEHAMGTGSTLVGLDACDSAIAEEALNRRDRAATHSNRGILHARRGRQEAAIRDYSRALALEPALVRALINRANAYTRLKRWEDALADYDSAVTFSQGRNALVFYNRSLAYEKLGRKAEAREDLVRALQIQPESRALREALASLE
jgi:tetratricopeptide (TPR) repeat protein